MNPFAALLFAGPVSALIGWLVRRWRRDDKAFVRGAAERSPFSFGEIGATAGLIAVRTTTIRPRPAVVDVRHAAVIELHRGDDLWRSPQFGLGNIGVYWSSGSTYLRLPHIDQPNKRARSVVVRVPSHMQHGLPLNARFRPFWRRRPSQLGRMQWL